MSAPSFDWVNYIKERENVEVLETTEGFATYSIKQPECYIKDIYVKPEFRQKHIASKLADKISVLAREMGCKYLTGSVSPITNNSTESLKVLLGYGFRLHSSQHNIIYFIKDL